MKVEPNQKCNAPERLTALHQLESFNSGNHRLDEWLKSRAIKNEDAGASRTYVVSIQQKVVGYYCLANGGVAHSIATNQVKRNMPDPIPVMIIGRLAVDLLFQKQGIGRSLVRDAILRVMQAAEIAGIRAILVHAGSEKAKQFYENCGFKTSPIEPMTLLITVAEAKKALGH